MSVLKRRLKFLMQCAGEFSFHAAAAATCLSGLTWAFGVYAAMIAVAIVANPFGLGRTPIANVRGGLDGAFRLIRGKSRKTLGFVRRVTATLPGRLLAR